MTAHDGLIIFLEDLKIWFLNAPNWQTQIQTTESKKSQSILSEMWRALNTKVVNHELLAKLNFELHQIMLFTTPSEILSKEYIWNSYFDMLELIMSAKRSEKVPISRLSDLTIEIIKPCD